MNKKYLMTSKRYGILNKLSFTLSYDNDKLSWFGEKRHFSEHSSISSSFTNPSRSSALNSYSTCKMARKIYTQSIKRVKDAISHRRSQEMF